MVANHPLLALLRQYLAAGRGAATGRAGERHRVSRACGAAPLVMHIDARRAAVDSVRAALWECGISAAERSGPELGRSACPGMGCGYMGVR